MTEALRRHRDGSARVVPIILRPCAWQTAPFADLQVLPKDGRPITLWPNQDEACLDVAEGVMNVVREIRGEPISDRTHAVPTDAAGRLLAVRVHRGYFPGQNAECHFVNLTNLSSSRIIEVTHIWYEDEAHHIPIMQPSRPLPVRLELDQSWETWVQTWTLPSPYRENAMSRFRARISTGEVFASVANPSVPPMGFVPGGPVT
jgi:hypothetical protein